MGGAGMTVRVEASDRWVRAYVGDTVVVDARSPLLFWERSFPVPGYAFLPADVRTDLLRPAAGDPPTEPFFFLPHGPVAERFDLEIEGRRIPHAAWVHDDPNLAERIVFSWQPGLLDRWTEEEEEVAGHPRDPYHRVDALPSRRRVTISAGGVQLADSSRPVLLFETRLPTRYYLPVEDVDLGRLAASDNRSHCPYKGYADRYWTYPGGLGTDEIRNLAWSYSAPGPAVGAIAGRIAFYNELVDITVDGQPQERPISPFSDPKHRPGS